jgi:hypothetical protein
MTYIIKLARQHGKPVQEQNAEVEYLFTIDGIEALLAAERNACLKAAASVNDEGSHNQRLMKRRIRAAIRARSKP